MDEVVQRLHSTTDASVWAKEWCKAARAIADRAEPDTHVIDEGWMTSWFANAIEVARRVGHDEGMAEASAMLGAM